MNATKNGIKNCPHCKAIDEAILEGVFLEAFGLLAGNFDDVLDIVMSNVEEALNNAEDVRKKQQLDKDISSLESKKSRMTDMLIDGTISKEVYDEKVLEFTRKLHTLSERRHLLEESINKQKDVGKRMSALREALSKEQVLDEFDRVVFESIIEKVLVGGFDEGGNPDPCKLTFILKGNQSGAIPNAKEHYKAMQKELKNGRKDSMNGKLRNMTGLYLRQGNNLLLLRRIGSRVVSDSYIASAGGHFEEKELNNAKACVLRELYEETGLAEREIDNLSLRYITLRLKNNEIRQNYYFFADLTDDKKVITSNEGNLKWFQMGDLLKTMPEMPFTARYVVKHYIEIGKNTDVLYAGIATESDVAFTEMKEF